MGQAPSQRPRACLRSAGSRACDQTRNVMLLEGILQIESIANCYLDFQHGSPSEVQPRASHHIEGTCFCRAVANAMIVE